MTRWAWPSHGSRRGASLRLVALLASLTGLAHAQRFDVDRPRPEPAAEPARVEPFPPAVRPTPAAPPEPPPQGWYGTGAVVTDAAAVGLAVTAATSGKGLLLIPAYASYLLGAPVNHLAHGQTGQAGISITLRLAPLLVAALALEPAIYELEGAEGNDGTCQSACTVFVGSMFVAPVVIAALDDALLARHPASSSPVRSSSSASLAWLPTVTPRREGGLSLGVLGRF